jgi:protein TonB
MRWVLPAIAVSLALHGALLGWLGNGSDALPGSEAQVKSTVIVFDTPPALSVSAADGSDNDRASSAATDGLASTEDPLAPAPVAEPEPEPEQIVEAGPAPAADTAAETAGQDVEPAEPGPATGTAAVPLPRVKPALPDDVAERIAREKAERAAQAKSQAEAKRQAEAERKAEARKRADERRRAQAKRKADAKARANAKRKADAKRKAGSKRAASRRASTGRKGGASAGDKRAYARRVLSHIQRHKRHPGGAAGAGVVRLSVRISGSGSLSSARVARSSGSATLDRAAVATARRASPYPAPPGGGAFSFTVSLRYTR